MHQQLLVGSLILVCRDRVACLQYCLAPRKRCGRVNSDPRAFCLTPDYYQRQLFQQAVCSLLAGVAIIWCRPGMRSFSTVVTLVAALPSAMAATGFTYGSCAPADVLATTTFSYLDSVWLCLHINGAVTSVFRPRVDEYSAISLSGCECCYCCKRFSVTPTRRIPATRTCESVEGTVHMSHSRLD